MCTGYGLQQEFAGGPASLDDRGQQGSCRRGGGEGGDPDLFFGSVEKREASA